MATGLPPRKQEIYFASEDQKLSIPKDIPIGEIDSAACNDPSRRSLFVLLGAKTFSKDLVCDSILRTQGAATFDVNAPESRVLISHAVFLYNAGWKNPDNRQLWVATEEEGSSEVTKCTGVQRSPILQKCFSSMKVIGLCFSIMAT